MWSHHRLNTCAWLSLVTALALHVVDEAVNDFLPFYNQTITTIRETAGFGPPSFTFPAWLGGLIVGIAIGCLLTPWIARGGKAPRLLAGIFSLLMILNGLLYITASIVRTDPVPGVLSSPVLTAAAAWMLLRAMNGAWDRTDPGSLKASGRVVA
jgi:hypothetical protein